jgi:hypothetical protein
MTLIASLLFRIEALERKDTFFSVIPYLFVLVFLKKGKIYSWRFNRFVISR